MGRWRWGCEEVVGQSVLLQLTLPERLPQWVHMNLFSAFRNSQGSMLTLGAIDTSHYNGSLHWVPITVQQYWQFTVDK